MNHLLLNFCTSFKDIAIKRTSTLLLLTLCFTGFLNAQNAGPDPVLGTAEDFSEIIADQVNKTQSNKKYSNVLSEQSNQITLKTPTGEFIGTVNLARTLGSSMQIVGAGEKAGAEFELRSDACGRVSGLYTSIPDKITYKYYTDSTDGTVRVKEVDINSVLCVDYNTVADESELKSGSNTTLGLRRTQASFQSLPNSKFVAYLDFDGEVYQGSWNGGQTINAQSHGISDSQIEQIWQYVEEDFAPFDINVTTSRTVYDATPTKNKIMVIITPTRDASPGSGGVAYTGSFGTDNVCWVFNSGIAVCANTISHELGHTMGLSHDGDAASAYYHGHNDWGTIMGSSWIKTVFQWSKGEYNGADNKEDDLHLISTNNAFGYRQDQVGNDIHSATLLKYQSSGAVSTNDNKGLIERTNDIDVFSFSTNTGGNVALNVMPSSINPNLNIKARLLDANGNQILVSDPSNTLAANLMGTVGSGTFYVEIDGVGDGANPSVGYSDYNSMGAYSIGGSVPPNAVIADCNNEIGGTANVDACGVCAGGNTGITPNTTCTADCNNVVNGTAFIDNCGVCSGGSTGKVANASCVKDCNNDWNGAAGIDNCGVCAGGNTGKTANATCVKDCNFVWNGTGCIDCNNVKNGTALIDYCYVCSGGNTGIIANSTCVVGCDTIIQAEDANFGAGATAETAHAGYNGTGYVDLPSAGGFVQFIVRGCTAGQYTLEYRHALGGGDRTGKLHVNSTNQPLTATGSGSWTSYKTESVTINLVEGTNQIVFESTGSDFGNLDQIEIKKVVSADCNGDANGSAFIDGCNICVGGNTGKTKIVNGIPDGFIFLGNEGDVKTLPSKSDVVYGQGCNFAYLYDVTGSVTINNGTFGDPAPGQVKKAYYKAIGVVTSIDEQTTYTDLNIYPNPAQNQVTIQGEFKRWILTDALGAFIKAGTDKVINVGALGTGLYYLNIDGEVMKFIKI